VERDNEGSEEIEEKKIHTLIAIDTVQGCMHHTACLLEPAGYLSLCSLHTSMSGGLLFAGKLHIDSAVLIARASEPVVSKHLWATNTAGQVW
jgi:hypothetical protein